MLDLPKTVIRIWYKGYMEVLIFYQQHLAVSTVLKNLKPLLATTQIVHCEDFIFLSSMYFIACRQVYEQP